MNDNEKVKKIFPVLHSERLNLRQYKTSDADSLPPLIGDRAIADVTAGIPYPYTKDIALEWFKKALQLFNDGAAIHFLITLKQSGVIIGGIGFMINQSYNHAELGYWIGKPYWNKGYASEAALRVLEYGFKELKLNRIHADHFSRNPASGRVLQKIGMQYEGHMRQHLRRWENYEDIDCYGILRSDWEAGR